jgi:hypothetical protein
MDDIRRAAAWRMPQVIVEQAHGERHAPGRQRQRRASAAAWVSRWPVRQRMIRRWDTAQPPLERLLASKMVSAEQSERLAHLHATVNPPVARIAWQEVTRPDDGVSARVQHRPSRHLGNIFKCGNYGEKRLLGNIFI